MKLSHFGLLNGLTIPITTFFDHFNAVIIGYILWFARVTKSFSALLYFDVAIGPAGLMVPTGNKSYPDLTLTLNLTLTCC